MRDQDEKLKVHFFVCTNKRDNPNKASCGNKSAESIRETLKKMIHDAGLKSKVRINAAGCLGHCEKGVVCVAYPKGDWIFEAEKKSAEEIFREILKIV